MDVGKSAADSAKRKISATAQTISAGVEVLGRSAASVSVLLRASKTVPGEQPSNAVLALRVALVKQGSGWKVVDLVPIKKA